MLQILRFAFVFCLYFLRLVCYLTPVFLAKCWNVRTLSSTSPIIVLRTRQLMFRCISWCNCISTGIFLAMCFLGLLPYVLEKFSVIFKKMEYKMTFPLAECIVVLGFFITLLLEQMLMIWQERKDAFSREDGEQGRGLLEECEMQDLSDDPFGVKMKEHNGHPVNDLHSESQDTKFYIENCVIEDEQMILGNMDHRYHHSLLVRRESGFLFYILAFASALHSIFEGITLGLQTDIPKAVHLFIAIIIHECLVALALGANSTRLRYSFSSYVKFAVLFSATIPLGVAIGLAIGKAHGIGGELASAVLQGLSSGIFLHVIFQDFLPSQFSNKQDRLLKVCLIFVGFLIIAVVTYFINGY